ncbi:uncharacterized protein FIESC28_10220 [Fusarium coffeatum]|uniref:Uncharacterized protein n=1 Tax=Fusarium coffeatum TaxID=231269 RepID=A0A366QUT3_9HYPO|nr:uncharacterized protein FIESC28_10220 [Fusarium coffeatum]RBR08472.1 hypothetical protein FIESC28_10220 [Fusarium coffeatum]
MGDSKATADQRCLERVILSEDDLTLKELHSFDDLVMGFYPEATENSRSPSPFKEPSASPPRPELLDTGVEVGVMRDDSATHGTSASIPGSKRKADNDGGRSAKRTKVEQPGQKAYCTVSVTKKSGLNIKWKTGASSFTGPDKVLLIGYSSISKAKFAAMEAHDRFQRKTTASWNRDYLVALGRKRIKYFAAASRNEDKTPAIDDNLRAHRLRKPLLASDAQEAELKEILEHMQWRKESREH